jgi:hypothetical protein
MSVAAETNVPSSFSRRLSIGAEIVPEGGVHFRVWAPDPPCSSRLPPTQ